LKRSILIGAICMMIFMSQNYRRVIPAEAGIQIFDSSYKGSKNEPGHRPARV